MRVVFDLRICQSEVASSEAAGYELALATAVAGGAGDAVEVFVALGGGDPRSVERIRQALDGMVPPERVLVARLPGRGGAGRRPETWSHQAGELVWAAFLESLHPDVVHSSVALGDAGVPGTRRGPLSTFVISRTVHDAPPTRLETAAGADVVVAPNERARDHAASLLSLSEDAIVDIPLLQASSHAAAAEAALAAFGRALERLRAASPPGDDPAARPRLAYVSPLPPARTGIADYSAELLPELAAYYDVEVVVSQPVVDESSIPAGMPVRSVAWFQKNVERFDRILYQFGNSLYHDHMFDLLEHHPGVVVLHDFFLSGALHYRDRHGHSAGTFARSLYRSHGYHALMTERARGREAAVWKYPCNLDVLRRADGIIVHSKHSTQLADTWYGPGYAADWRIIPHLRGPSARADREAARKRLGIEGDDFLIVSLGALGPTKMCDRLVTAWLASPLSRDQSCALAFVGEAHDDDFCRALRRTISRSSCEPRVRVTGAVSRAVYEDYLLAADMAVQLRTLSRGETSGAVLDCFSFGVATLANAEGSIAELPDDVLLKIPREFSQDALAKAMVQLQEDSAARAAVARRAKAHVASVHAPARVASDYRDAIEHFAKDSDAARYRALLSAIGGIESSSPPGREQVLDVAVSIAANRPPRPPRQILYDVSALVHEDLKTGIERATRAVLNALLDDCPTGFRVEPVYDAGGRLVYARRFTSTLLGVDVSERDDTIEPQPGDVFLAINLTPDSVARHRELFASLRERGVRVFFVVHDILPLLRPDAFPDWLPAEFERWLDTVAGVADGLVSPSRAVAEEVLTWLRAGGPHRDSPLLVGYAHWGADLAASLPSRGHDPQAASLATRRASGRRFLMVGTVEPRKGHGQVLGAFESLWAEGEDVELVLIGKEGWCVDGLAQRLRGHPEQGSRLHWLSDVSDEMLLKVYRSADALLVASEGEGFGLPLIEAAQHDIPIIARDIPVFREVAGDHAYYFTGDTAEELAAAVADWLVLSSGGSAPDSSTLPWLTWAESTRRLFDLLLGEQWYAVWKPAAPAPTDAGPAVTRA
jgi:glycosyltransferase involved in cell wall biosynthesis